MRDQPAVAIDYVSVAALADLQASDDIPDQLEIDLRDYDPSILSLLGHRQGQVWLRLFLEIDRTEPDAVPARFGKAGVLRVVVAAADNIHCQARDLELLLARLVGL